MFLIVKQRNKQTYLCCCIGYYENDEFDQEVIVLMLLMVVVLLVHFCCYNYNKKRDSYRIVFEAEVHDYITKRNVKEPVIVIVVKKKKNIGWILSLNSHEFNKLYMSTFFSLYCC